MNHKDLLEIMAWLSSETLAGADGASILEGFCDRCVRAGLTISRAMAIIDTLHPEFEGRAFQWDLVSPVDKPEQTFASTQSGHAREVWESSVFHHLLTTGGSEVRREIFKGAPLDFHTLADLASRGHTDYVAMIHRFSERGSIGDMNAVYSAWTSTAPQGFRDDELEALRLLLPALAAALKCESVAGIAKTIARVYLGEDAAAQVMRGQITRGGVEAIDAVIWFSDLKNYTAISDVTQPEHIIPFLNDYAGLVIDCIHRHGGSVLKLMGDGVLAIFKHPSMQQACENALLAEAALRKELDELNTQRTAQAVPTTGLYIGLHVGRVFYGNIGSRDRLDFTVVGPTVNEVSRICSTCRPSGHDVLISRDFARSCHEVRRQSFRVVGEFSLRGVSEPKLLFTVPQMIDLNDEVQSFRDGLEQSDLDA